MNIVKFDWWTFVFGQPSPTWSNKIRPNPNESAKAQETNTEDVNESNTSSNADAPKVADPTRETSPRKQ